MNPNDELAYICEVKKEDLSHVIVVERTIDYGINVVDKTKVPRGPKFTQEPVDYVFDVSGRSQVNYASLRCVADGFPTPRYKWFKEEFEGNKNRIVARYIDPLEDSRLTQTDGTLIIFNPQQSRDRGKYHCTAENDYGKIRSRTVQLTFGCKFAIQVLVSKIYHQNFLCSCQTSANSQKDAPRTMARNIGASRFLATLLNITLVSFIQIR